MPGQPKTTAGRGKAAIVAVAMAIAMGMASHFEGIRHRSYADVAGVWTICKGHTHDVRPGQVATDTQCEAWLKQDMGAALADVQRCIRVPMTPGALGAFTDAAYNIGPRVVCGSSLQRKANAGDMQGACAELLRWVYANGKKVAGLLKRRRAEWELCTSTTALGTP
ncbi:MAG: lysozyme [Betaproteobacteria bacterium]|nr:lysozyme [Betaproteobacteria bacterium]